MKIQKKLTIALSVLVFFLACPLAYTQDSPSSGEAWEFEVIPYLWLVGIDGDVTVKGRRASVDVGFGDLIDYLDFGGMLHLEAGKGKWAFFIDPTYSKLSVDRTLIDVGSELALVELGGVYRFADLSLGKDEKRALSFQALAGGRYNYLEAEVDIFGLLGAKRSQNWVDPLVGVRIVGALTEKLSFRVRGDIGGFGIGSASNFTWNVVTALGYQLSRRIALGIGYRILDVDYDKGSGLRLFEYDVTMSGPMVGLAFRF